MASNQKSKGTDLGVLQQEAEATAKTLKGARTTLTNAKQAVEKAEKAHAVAQEALILGVDAVRAATKSPS